PAESSRVLRHQALRHARQESDQVSGLPPPGRHVPLASAHPRFPERYRPLLRRQGPHHRAPRSHQASVDDPGGHEAQADYRHADPGDNAVIHRHPQAFPQLVHERRRLSTLVFPIACVSSTSSTAPTYTTTTLLSSSFSNNEE